MGFLKSKRAITKLTAVVIAAIVAVAAVGGSLYYYFAVLTPMQAARSIKIGWVGPMTGAVAHMGWEGYRGVQLAAKEINDQGGLLVGGKRYIVEVIVGDTEFNVEKTRTVTERLIIMDNVLMLVGEVWTPAAFAIMDLAEVNKVPFLCSMSAFVGGPEYIKENNIRYTFQVSLPGRLYGGGLADAVAYMTEEGVIQPQTAALLIQDSDWGRGISKIFKDRLKELEPEVNIVLEELCSVDQTDFTGTLTKIKAANPDLVFDTNAGTPGLAVVGQRYDMGLTDILWVGGTATHSSPTFIDNLGAKSELVLANIGWEPLPMTTKTMPFVEAYEEMFPDQVISSLSAYSYDAMLVAFDSIKRAGALDREAITDAILETNLLGVSGTTIFDPEMHSQTEFKALIAQVQEQKFVVIWPSNVAEGVPLPP